MCAPNKQTNMIKKITHQFYKRWILKHPGLVTSWIVRHIAKQMANAHISFTHINKWLRHIGHPTICGYMMVNNQPLVFFEPPTPDRAKELGGNYIMIEVKRHLSS
jgi:hypothetical protein